MPSENDDFFDIPSSGNGQQSQTISQEESFFDIPSENTWTKPAAPEISEQIKNAVPLLAREGGAQLYSLPSTTAETLRFLGGKLQSLGEEQAAQQGREISEEEKNFTNNVVNYLPDLIKSLGEKFPSIFPTHEKAKETIGGKIEKNLGEKLPEKGRGVIEKAAEGAGKALPIALFPGSAAVKAAGIATSSATEAADLSEKGKLIGNLSVPALVSIVESIVRRKYIPPKGEAQRLYAQGKKLGMTDKQLAPIMATEGQIERHGGLAQGVKGTKQAFEETHDVLGNIIEDMQNRPQNSRPLPGNVEADLLTELGGIESGIRQRTHSLSPKEQSAIDFVNNTIRDIHNTGSTPKQLIGTWRSINKVGMGKTEIARVKPVILKAIEAVDPVLAEDLVATNKLYSKFLGNLKEINPSQFNAFIDAGELQNVLGAVFSGQTNTLTQSMLRFVGLNSLRKISSNILTNPSAQSLVRNFGKAVRDGRPASARAIGIQFKEYVKKNLPEEYKDIDWEKLISED